jgi:hypothetical protein
VSKAIFSDPELLLWQFEQVGSPLDPVGNALFVRMKASDFRRYTFLDERLKTRGPELVVGPEQLADLYAEQSKRRSPAAYIFHSAFCCSTLMGRLLDIPGKSLSLKEPKAIAQLANWKRGLDLQHRDESRPQLEALIGASIANMTTGFSRREKSQIKLHNCCNNMFRPLLTDSSRGLFMYSSLRNFLISVLKSTDRRRWVHNQLSVCVLDAGRLATVPTRDVQRLNDPEAAAYLWLLNIQSYVEAVESGDLEVRALDCEVLLQNPLQVAVRVAEYLNLEITETELAGNLAGGVMDTHAKTAAPGFNKAQRKKEMRMKEKELRREISHGLWWASRYSQNPHDRQIPGSIRI